MRTIMLPYPLPPARLSSAGVLRRGAGGPCARPAGWPADSGEADVRRRRLPACRPHSSCGEQSGWAHGARQSGRRRASADRAGCRADDHGRSPRHEGLATGAGRHLGRSVGVGSVGRARDPVRRVAAAQDRIDVSGWSQIAAPDGAAQGRDPTSAAVWPASRTRVKPASSAVSSVARSEEPLGAAEQARVVLCPAHAPAGPAPAYDLVQPEVDRGDDLGQPAEIDRALGVGPGERRRGVSTKREPSRTT